MMESQPQNPEFRINSENFHPCIQRSNNSRFNDVIENTVDLDQMTFTEAH